MQRISCDVWWKYITKVEFNKWQWQSTNRLRLCRIVVWKNVAKSSAIISNPIDQILIYNIAMYIAYCLHLNSNILDLLLHPFPKCFPSRKVLCFFIRWTNSCPRNKVLHKRKLSSVKCMQGTIVDGQCSLRRSDLFPPGLFQPRAGREYLSICLLQIWTDKLWALVW